MHKIGCHHCKTEWEFEPPMGRRDECPKCSSDARVCRNCKLFDQNSYRECREEQADWVKEKDKGNFCSYFTASMIGGASQQSANAKDKLNELFGNSKKEDTPKPGANLADELAKFLDSKK